MTLSDATAAQPTFTAPLVPRAGTTVLTFQVIARDAGLPSAPATTTVTVTNVNRPPEAIAGPAQTADERTVVQLNGTASGDPDADDTITSVDFSRPVRSRSRIRAANAWSNAGIWPCMLPRIWLCMSQPP